MFDNNFGKFGPISKIHQMICKKILYLHKDFHFSCNMLLRYLVKVKKYKNVTKFQR